MFATKLDIYFNRVPFFHLIFSFYFYPFYDFYSDLVDFIPFHLTGCDFMLWRLQFSFRFSCLFSSTFLFLLLSLCWISRVRDSQKKWDASPWTLVERSQRAAAGRDE